MKHQEKYCAGGRKTTREAFPGSAQTPHREVFNGYLGKHNLSYGLSALYFCHFILNPLPS